MIDHFLDGGVVGVGVNVQAIAALDVGMELEFVKLVFIQFVADLLLVVCRDILLLLQLWSTSVWVLLEDVGVMKLDLLVINDLLVPVFDEHSEQVLSSLEVEDPLSVRPCAPDDVHQVNNDDDADQHHVEGAAVVIRVFKFVDFGEQNADVV